MKSKFEPYNILWTTQSRDSSESMPLGGHDAGCNVWVADNELCLYLAQSGTFDENGTMLKLGRIRLWLEKKELLSVNFRQELLLEKGQIEINAGEKEEEVRFLLWQDVNNANLHISFQSQIPQRLHVSYDCWRYRDREVVPDETGQCRNYSTVGEPSPVEKVITYADEVHCEGNELWFFHQNRNDALVYDRAIRQQHLEEVQEMFPNPLKDRIMGGCMVCEDWDDAKLMDGVLYYEKIRREDSEILDQMEYHFQTGAVQETEILVSLETNQYSSIEAWKNVVQKKQNSGFTLSQNQRWWQQYFEKSFIIIDEKHPGSDYWNMGRNYQLFRYMLGCNYYGKWPTKFNGGLFTFYEKFTPDYRNWSGTEFTAQNQRLVYWPMLKTGDFEAMKVQLDFYKKLLAAGKARAKHYWGIDGAYFPEQLSCFGTSNCAEYRWSRRPGVPQGEDDNAWVRMHYSSALEFALMMLEYAEYSGADISEYLDFIDSVVRFYFNHYGTDENGKLRVFPSTALETYKGNPWAEDRNEYGAANPMDVAAGLREVLERLIRYLELHVPGSTVEAETEDELRCVTKTGAGGERKGISEARAGDELRYISKAEVSDECRCVLETKQNEKSRCSTNAGIDEILRDIVEAGGDKEAECRERSMNNIAQYRLWRDMCPDLPLGEENGQTVFLPAQEYVPEPFNCELPQLYPIFPYSCRGLSEEQKQIGRNTYNSPLLTEDQRLLVSWHQNGIFAARLGMPEEAMRVQLFKLGDSGRRFPAFWGPGHDWTPDHNWGGSGMIGLQEMLLQVKDDGYEVLPCWDRTVEVHFKLFVPGGETVEYRLEVVKSGNQNK